MSPQLEIQLIASVVAAACALPGVFLVLRRMALMSDAISHAILPGIAIAFFILKDISSPLLILAAALTGLLTVSLVELLNRSRLIKQDSAIGLVFPALFSLGVVLISRYAGNVHLDMDAVLLGELAFAPFNRLELFGVDLGAKAFVIMSVIFVINLAFILAFFKELKLATFDSGLAAALGFSPAIIHYSLMGMVSITAVGAFDAVGSVLVIALMITPPAAAYLLTDKLSRMLIASVFFAVISAVSGFWMADFLDASIAGSMAVMSGVVFLIVYIFAPQRGLLTLFRRRISQKWNFAQAMLTIHIANHENSPEAEIECRVQHLSEHLQWPPEFARQVVQKSIRKELIVRQDDLLKLTDDGRLLAAKSIMH